MAKAPSSLPLRDLVTMLLPGTTSAEWRIREDRQWCHVTPVDYPSRVQGWKLHISATWLSAPVVLYQAAQVLIEHQCAFKVAKDLHQVLELTSKRTEPAQAGKVITVYPRDDAQLRTLAPLLDQATAGLPGPVILSDRPYREGSLVHYRYGAFAGVPVLNNDGSMEARLEAPDGRLVEDQRRPWFCPPAWAAPPFEEAAPRQPADQPAKAKPVLLGGRYRVERAIVRSGRGGVYRAVDQEVGDRVIVKQARAHISGLNLTGDARDALRHEAAMLEALAGLVPAKRDSFDQGQHSFLVMEELPGQVLADWARQWWRPWRPERPPSPVVEPPQVEGPPVDEVRALAIQLVDLLAEVHQRGFVFRDLTPNNVMVLPDGTLRLIDVELVARPGQLVSTAYTPGFSAPEVMRASRVTPAPGREADCYSLGALLCFLATCAVPAFLPDRPTQPPGGRTYQHRVATTLEYAAARNPAAQFLFPAVVGLTSDDPAQRWTVDQVRRFLDRTDREPGRSLAATEPAVVVRADGRLEPERQQRLLDDGLAALVEAVSNHTGERLVPTDEAWGGRADPCAVQHGAAGVLEVLVRAGELTGDERIVDAVRRAASWIDRRRTMATQLLPGLYFGRSGTAWALYSAARLLDDAALAEHAVELLTALPVRWPNPDIAHGAAGLGMAHLRLWYETKEPVLLERVNDAADHLLAQARYQGERIFWRVDPEFDSALAGLAAYGFAHGVAGIGAFLLAVAQATGRPDCRRAAEAAGETLVAGAIRDKRGTYWPDSLSGPHDDDMRYVWCNGASGIGTFLIRLWQETGDARYRQLAHEAAIAVRHTRWLAGVSACHGAAGNGEFLLDLAAILGGPYRAWSEELAAILYTRAVLRDGRLLPADELGPTINLDFNTGLGGVAGFLIRLRHGGTRWFMVDTPVSGSSSSLDGALGSSHGLRGVPNQPSERIREEVNRHGV